MKKWICVAAATLFATAAVAEEKHFVCVSDMDGSETRLSRASEGDKGSIATDKIEGDAIVLKGVGNITFLHMNGADVMTFVVQFEDLTYDLSIKGPHAGNDRGKCTEMSA